MQEALKVLSTNETVIRIQKFEKSYAVYLENDNWPKFPNRDFDPQADNLDSIVVELTEEVKAKGWVR